MARHYRRCPDCGCLLAVKLWPRSLPADDCSALYQWYKGVDDVDVVYVSDYKINDTMTVGVTTIVAKTDSAWARVTEAFALKAPPKSFVDTHDSNYIFTGNANAKDRLVMRDSIIGYYDLVSHVWDKKLISVFHTYSSEQRKVVFGRIFDVSVKISKHEEIDESSRPLFGR